MLIFQLKKSSLRVFLLSIPFCVLSGQAYGQPPAEKIELVKSALAALAESDQQASFKKAHSAINQLIVADSSHNHFAHAVLIAKLLIAVDKRASLLELDEPDDGLTDLISLDSISLDSISLDSISLDSISLDSISLDSGDLSSNGSLGSSLSFDTEKASLDDLRSAQDIELKKYLDKFGARLTRGFFTYYRIHFAGDDDLQAIFEKATEDKIDQKRMLNRYLSEFKQLDKKYSVMSGKLRRK